MTASRSQRRAERRCDHRTGVFLPSLSCWLLLLLALVTVPEVCLAQDDTERTEDGTEQGPNSELAKKVEVYLPGALGGMLLLAVLLYCCCKARSASARINEEEAGANDDIEPGIQGTQLQKIARGDNKYPHANRTVAPSMSPIERITRPAVMSWGSKSSTSTSAASTSSRDEVSTQVQRQARSVARSGSRERYRAPSAARPASTLPSDVQGRTTTRTDARGRSRRVHEHHHQPMNQLEQ